MQSKNDDKKHILVIDDETDIQDLLRDFLEEKNFRVSLAGDGIKAMELIEKDLPHLAVIDLLLPGEHGISVIRNIKEKYFFPVIMISSIYSLDQVENFMEEYFVEAFMEKPLDLNQLHERINSLMAKQQKTAPGNQEKPGEPA